MLAGLLLLRHWLLLFIALRDQQIVAYTNYWGAPIGPMLLLPVLLVVTGAGIVTIIRYRDQL